MLAHCGRPWFPAIGVRGPLPCLAMLLTAAAAVAAPALAAEVRVASVDELRAAIAAAAPGDKIIVADGAYDVGERIEISRAGAEGQPIEIAAQTVGGVEIKGAAGFTFRPGAAYVQLRGFKLTHAAGAVELPVGTHHCRVTRNVFELQVGDRSTYVTVAGDDHEIDHNTFQNKRTEGQMLFVVGPEAPAMAQRTWIHHNYFFNFENSRRNNSSALHIGHSARSLTGAHSVVEYNLFVQTRGENEGAICNKSGDNIYRFNTIGEGCTELSLRHGNRCHVYGNFLIGTTGGLRFFGDDHKIYSNYFERNRVAVQIGNGDGIVPPAKLTSHDRPDRVELSFNTLVNNRSNFSMGGRGRGLGATELVVANNLVQGGGSAASIDGPLPDARWEGNIVWGTADGAGDMPESGFTAVDPQLQQGAGGVFRLQAGSPAIGKAAGSFAHVKVNVDNQPRGTALDVGADQFSTESAVARMLTPEDVGPDAP